MIVCHNCGFGHLTVEESRACRPWSEIQAQQKACPHIKMEPIWWLPGEQRCDACGYTETVQNSLQF